MKRVIEAITRGEGNDKHVLIKIYNAKTQLVIMDLQHLHDVIDLITDALKGNKMEPAKNDTKSEQFEKDAMMKKSGISLKAFSGIFFYGCAIPDQTFSILNP